VDFWLLVGRLFRRWYLTIPLFVLAGIVAGGVGAGVRSSYKTDTQVLLVPAGAPTIPTDPSSPPAGNPLLESTRNQLDAATQAATFILDAPAKVDERRAANPGSSVHFALVEEAPIITVHTTGADPDVVRAATTNALAQLDDALVQVQEPIGTVTANRIETVRLAEPTLVEENGDRNRVLVGTLVAGLLTASLIVLAADYGLRRRLERRLTIDLDAQVGRIQQPAHTPGAHDRLG
jgi:hypothetical protein